LLRPAGAGLRAATGRRSVRATTTARDDDRVARIADELEGFFVDQLPVRDTHLALIECTSASHWMISTSAIPRERRLSIRREPQRGVIPK
jgi:hypothetical protein